MDWRQGGDFARESHVSPDRISNVQKFADSIIETAKTEQLAISELRAACMIAVNEAERRTLVYGRTLMDAAQARRASNGGEVIA